MLETYSPSGSEAMLANLLLDEMSTMGFATRTDKAGNVIGKVGREGPRILLCGHMDTVPGFLPVIEKDGILHGRGAVDAKTPLAAMILGCSIASRRGSLPFQATIAAVVEEETTSKGMNAIVSENPCYDLAVFGEPSGSSNIIIGYKGSSLLNITCKTSGGHSSSPWLSKNSLEEAFEFWTHLRQSIFSDTTRPRFSAVTGCLINARTSKGGNTIPSEATLQIDVRIPPGVLAGEIVREVENFRKRYLLDHDSLELAAVIGDTTPPYVGDLDSVGVRVFRYAIRKSVGGNVFLVKKTGTSDLNLLSEHSPGPMIAYGPGDASLDHTDQERIAVSEYLQGVEVYATAIERFASLMAQSSLPVLA
jgi:LysW-gamma-L-lysine carboxypeptidase